MKYGYRVNGSGMYIPQYDNGTGWQDFKGKHLGGDFYRICLHLADLSAPRIAGGQLLLDPGDKKIPESEHVVFFTKPVFLHAFIGAAKYWYDQQKSTEIIDP
jgi:hypothetical protein